MACTIDWTNADSFPLEDEAVLLFRENSAETVTLETCPLDGMVWKDKDYQTIPIEDGDFWEYAVNIRDYMRKQHEGMKK